MSEAEDKYYKSINLEHKYELAMDLIYELEQQKDKLVRLLLKLRNEENVFNNYKGEICDLLEEVTGKKVD